MTYLYTIKLINHKKKKIMKNATVRFTVMTNRNVYFASSMKAAVSFCKANDFVISRDWDIETTSITERNTAVKCGRGVWCILDQGINF